MNENRECENNNQSYHDAEKPKEVRKVFYFIKEKDSNNMSDQVDDMNGDSVSEWSQNNYTTENVSMCDGTISANTMPNQYLESYKTYTQNYTTLPSEPCQPGNWMGGVGVQNWQGNSDFNATVTDNYRTETNKVEPQLNRNVSYCGGQLTPYLCPGVMTDGQIVRSRGDSVMGFAKSDVRRDKIENAIIGNVKHAVDKVTDNMALEEELKIKDRHKEENESKHIHMFYAPNGDLNYYIVNDSGMPVSRQYHVIENKHFAAFKVKSESECDYEILKITWEGCCSDCVFFLIRNGIIQADCKIFLRHLHKAGLVLSCSNRREKELAKALYAFSMKTEAVVYLPYTYGWYMKHDTSEWLYYSDGLTFEEVLNNAK